MAQLNNFSELFFTVHFIFPAGFISLFFLGWFSIAFEGLIRRCESGVKGTWAFVAGAVMLAGSIYMDISTLASLTLFILSVTPAVCVRCRFLMEGGVRRPVYYLNLLGVVSGIFLSVSLAFSSGNKEDQLIYSLAITLIMVIVLRSYGGLQSAEFAFFAKRHQRKMHERITSHQRK